MSEVTLRPVAAEDDAFLCAVYGSTREEELAQVPWTAEQRAVFIRFQFDAQQRHYQSEFPHAVHQIILRDGVPVGRLYVDRRAHELRILDLALLTAARGHGIGSWLLQRLMEEAATARLPLTIQLDRFGRGHALFARLGFAPVSESESHTLYQWEGNGMGSETGKNNSGSIS